MNVTAADKNKKLKMGIIIGVMVLYAFSFKSIYAWIGPSVGIFSVVPALITAWYFGLVRGITVSLVSIPLTMVYIFLSGPMAWQEIVADGPGFYFGNLIALTVTALVGRFRDIDTQLKIELVEREKAEAALRESEAKFHRLADASFEGIALHDNGVILEANQALAKMFGYELEELEGISVLDLAVPESHERIMANIRAGYERPYEILGLRKDGSKFNIEISAKMSSYKGQVVRVAAVRDITERKKAEENLRTSEEKLRSTINSIDDLVFALNIDGIFLEYYQPQSSFLDIPPAEIVGKSYKDVLPEEVTNLVGKAFRALLDTGEVHEFDYQMEFEGGKAWFHAKMSPRIDISGEINGATVVTRDITERVLFQEALVQRNKELDTYTHVVSHDLRAPLRAMINYSRFLQEDSADQLDELGLEYIDGIIDSAQRMDRLVKELLEYSRIGRMKLELVEIDMGVFLEQLVDYLNFREKAEIKLPESAPTIWGFQLRIEQIFSNLLSNAVKFHKNGSQPVIRMDWADKGKYWDFSVKDNGIGMQNDHLSKIFDVFQRLHTQDEYDGTGIGLSIVKKAVEEHGGNVSVDSIPGQGSTFTISIPKHIPSQGKR